MKFFVDTADTAAIRELNDLGMVDGVTTNPSLILKAGRDILEVTKEICDMVSGPVSAEVVATEAREMIAEGMKLSKIAPNIAIKVPLTWDGLTACKAFASEGLKVNVTLCFSPIYDNYDFRTEILAASIRSVNHIVDCAKIGADVVTAPPAVIKAMASHVLTDKGLDQFLKDWAKTGQKIL